MFIAFLFELKDIPLERASQRLRGEFLRKGVKKVTVAWKNRFAEPAVTLNTPFRGGGPSLTVAFLFGYSDLTFLLCPSSEPQKL